MITKCRGLALKNVVFSFNVFQGKSVQVISLFP